MRFLFIIAAIILTTTTISGQKCKYISNTVSGMDGSRLVITSPQKFAANQAEVWAKLHQDSLVVLAIVLKEAFPVSFPQGNQIVFGADNQEILSVAVMQDAERDVDSEKPLTVYSILNPSDFSVLADREINQIRMQTEDGWIDLEAASKKDRKAIARVVGCIIVII